MVEKNGSVKYSAIVKVNLGDTKTGFMVTPNPIVGNAIKLQLSNMKAGAYTIHLINASGQNVYIGSLDVSTGSGTASFMLKRHMAKGKYILRLSNDQTSFSKSILLQ
jgi:hypothetical protein